MRYLAMIDVFVSITGILMGCDESILHVNLGREFSLRKVAFEDLSFKNKITDAQGRLDYPYYGSRILDGTKEFFICIEKNSSFQINGPQITGETHQVFISKDIMCDEEIEAYTNQEMEYLHKIISLLRIYKAGNISLGNMFFTYRYVSLGFVSNTQNVERININQNIADSRKYTLTPDEATSCNSFILQNINNTFALLKNSIEEFSWGLTQNDIATGFEQYTTALEMTLLSQNQQGKKQALANRTAVLIGSNQAEVSYFHQKMLDFYRFRSESLHEGDGRNITITELHEMETIVRLVLQKCLIRCNTELAHNPHISWATIKANQITDLKNQVIILQAQGLL